MVEIGGMLIGRTVLLCYLFPLDQRAGEDIICQDEEFSDGDIGIYFVGDFSAAFFTLIIITAPYTQAGGGFSRALGDKVQRINAEAESPLTCYPLVDIAAIHLRKAASP